MWIDALTTPVIFLSVEHIRLLDSLHNPSNQHLFISAAESITLNVCCDSHGPATYNLPLESMSNRTETLIDNPALTILRQR